MNCHKCNNKFNIQQFLPVIDKQGETQCLKCFSTINSESIPMINKQLIKLMGRCPKHIQCQLSLLNIKDRKVYCPKCVIFNEDKNKYEKMEFIQIDGQQKKIENIILNNQIILKERRQKINSSIIDKVNKVKKQAIQNLDQKILFQYNSIVEKLKEKRNLQQKQINKNIQLLEQQFWIQEMVEYNKIQQRYQALISQNEKNLKIQGKYNKLADLIQLNENILQIQKTLELQCQLICEKLRIYQKQYQCNFNLQFKVKQKLEKQEKKELNKIIEDELLINLVSPKKIIKQIIFEKVQEIQEISTQNNSVTHQNSFIDQKSIKSYRTINNQSLSTSRTFVVNKNLNESQTKLSNSKSSLFITKIGQINKIETHVRQVFMTNLNLSNNEGKNVIEKISKSFVKNLDLSHNKLTGAFLKDLNKSQIGKYLKSIKLSNNNIDMKDSTISKKIEQLKAQGVTIII